MAKNDGRKGVQLSATVDKGLADALEEYRWTVRLNMTDLVRVALTEYAENHGVTVAAPETVDSE